MISLSAEPTPDAALAVIRAARVELDAAAAKAALTRDQAGYLLAASSAGLGGMEVAIAAITRPMDAELRTGILAAVGAIHERQARLERQERVALARGRSWHGQRPALAWTCVAAALLACGAGLFWVGWSYGGRASVAALCQGSAVREQAGGRTCSFWIMTPPQQAGRTAPKS